MKKTFVFIFAASLLSFFSVFASSNGGDLTVEEERGLSIPSGQEMPVLPVFSQYSFLYVDAPFDPDDVRKKIEAELSKNSKKEQQRWEEALKNKRFEKLNNY